MTLFLVRHARAGERGAWKGDDLHRPLDKRGQAQADALVALLAPFEPTQILSSPSRRCVDTVAPLAKHLGLKVRETDALAEGNSKEAIRLVRSLVDDSSTVICSHGDVVPDVLSTLAADGMEGWIGHEQCQKGSVWAIETKRRRARSARYFPPKA